MGSVDLHIHTNASACGLHTLLEVLALSRQKGLALVAITDHDHGRGTGIRVLSYRFPGEWNGVRVLSGIEFSIRDGGEIRIPPAVKVADLDICLAGFHDSDRTLRDDPVRCTDDLEAMLGACPFVDMLTHPTIRGYGLEHARAARLIAQHGLAVEANNAALLYAKEDPETLRDFLGLCAGEGVPVAINSDAHTASELGEHDQARQVVEAAGVPEELVLTDSVERVLAFVEQRNNLKQ